MRKQIVAVFTIAAFFGIYTANAQGLIIDDKHLEAFEPYQPEDLGFAEDLPAKSSLRAYAPTPRNQQGSTCVGWASAYAAMSIQFNYNYGITDRLEKDAFAFDPYFLYHQIKGTDNFDCGKGSSLLNALLAMRDYGVKRQLMPAHIVCENDLAESLYNQSLGFAKPFRIKDALIFDLEGAETRETMKYAITLGMPVLIGTNITEQMEIDSRAKHGAGVGLWEPKPEYKDKLGGHAMCIIGYDDNKFGGAWEIQNSWGTDIGDNGYIWVKYEDFNQIAVAAVVIETYEFNTQAPACQIGDCETNYSRADFGNGEKYEGEVSGGYYSGWGYKVLKDKSIYCGPWSEGYMHGKGFYLAADHTWYIVQMDKGNLVDSQALGFASSTEEEDQVTEASAAVLGDYLNFDDGMPDAGALESAGRGSTKQ